MDTEATGTVKQIKRSSCFKEIVFAETIAIEPNTNPNEFELGNNKVLMTPNRGAKKILKLSDSPRVSVLIMPIDQHFFTIVAPNSFNIPEITTTN